MSAPTMHLDARRHTNLRLQLKPAHPAVHTSGPKSSCSRAAEVLRETSRFSARIVGRLTSARRDSQSLLCAVPTCAPTLFACA
jgi:hypothetical protein